MKEIDETLSTYIDRIERFEDQFSTKDIIISTDLQNELLIDGDDDDIEKEPILWRLFTHNMFYIVTVPAGKTVPVHCHEEPIFRFISQGSLILNNQYDLKAGTWFVVKANTPYHIETKEGYTAISVYVSRCQTSNPPRQNRHGVKDKNST